MNERIEQGEAGSTREVMESEATGRATLTKGSTYTLRLDGYNIRNMFPDRLTVLLRDAFEDAGYIVFSEGQRFELLVPKEGDQQQHDVFVLHTMHRVLEKCREDLNDIVYEIDFRDNSA